MDNLSNLTDQELIHEWEELKAKYVINERHTVGIVDELIKRYKAATEWIPVSERLPEGKTSVLCFVKCKNGDMKQYTGHVFLRRDESTQWIVGNYFSWDIGEVTHWKPLPEPPKSPSK